MYSKRRWVVSHNGSVWLSKKWNYHRQIVGGGLQGGLETEVTQATQTVLRAMCPDGEHLNKSSRLIAKIGHLSLPSNMTHESIF